MVVGPVPVMVTEYPTVVVWMVLVMVAVAVAGGVTVVGLTVHTGVEVVGCVEVIWQPRVTVPLKLFTGSTRIDVAEVPPGAMATGSSAVVVSVNSLVPCSRAAGATARDATRTHNAATAATPFHIFNLDRDPSKKFTMSRFKVASIPGTRKKVPGSPDKGSAEQGPRNRP